MGRLTPQEIRDQEFKQSALGYSKEQVAEFLDAVAEEIETLGQEMNTLFQELKEAKLALQTYANVEASLKETLVQAKAAAQETLKNAQDEAENIQRKALVDKDALLFSAKEDLAAMQNEIRQLKAKRDEMLTRLKSLLRSNLDVLSDSFPDREASTAPLEDDLNIVDEQIIDFSKADMSMDDLPLEPQPELASESEPVPESDPTPEPEIEEPPAPNPDDVFNIPPEKEDQ